MSRAISRREWLRGWLRSLAGDGAWPAAAGPGAPGPGPGAADHGVVPGVTPVPMPQERPLAELWPAGRTERGSP